MVPTRPHPSNPGYLRLAGSSSVITAERIVGSHGRALFAGDDMEGSVAESAPRCQRGVKKWYELFHRLESQHTFVFTVIVGVWGIFEG